MKRKTETSRFGSGKRESHDSSFFYSRKMYEGVYIEERKEVNVNAVPKELINTVICRDSRNLDCVPDECVHLVVTSPPYNVGKEYDRNLTFPEYMKLLEDVMTEMHRILIDGGRACINIANVGRKPYIPLVSNINLMMFRIGYLMRGEIIWIKGRESINGEISTASAGSSTAWGTYRSALNPVLRDIHEYILIYSKLQFSSPKNENGCEKKNTITKGNFLEYTRSVWIFPGESAKRIGHPAPFPVELPSRCIELYTYKNDVVVDPFNGSGTTCVAAHRSGRRYIGVDNLEKYCELARDRLDIVKARRKLDEFA